MSQQEGLIDQALSLIAGAEIASERGARQAASRLAAWRTRAPEHEAAYAEALRRWNMLSMVAPDMRERFPETMPVQRSRRGLLGLGITVAGSALLGGAGWYWGQPLYRASHASGPGQTSYALLPDQAEGSNRITRVDLSADTRLDVRLYRGERVVELQHGEALFAVAPDRSRPFRVKTRAGEVLVVGTRFTVSDRGGPVSIAVEEGHVRFSPAPRDARWYSLSGKAVDLHARQAITWQNGELEPLREVEADSIAAWRQGWLWFDNRRLDEALPAINAFRSRPLRAASPAVAALRLTGRLRSADADQAAGLLETILPVQASGRESGPIDLFLTGSETQKK